MREINKNKTMISYFSIVISVISIVLASILFLDNNDLQKQLNKRDSLIDKKIISDSIINRQRLKNDTIIEKYISDCGIVINDKKITTEELVLFINKKIDMIDLLNTKVLILQDSLSIYKSFIDLTKRNLNVNYRVNESNKNRVTIIDLPKDTISIYKKLYQNIEKIYGIKYKIKFNDNNITFEKVFTKADSALLLYDYYNDKLKKDKSGNWIIEYQEKKKK